MKKIAGIDFGPIWGASGATNFFGEGWPYHRRLKQWFPNGFDYTGLTLVAKTTTLDPREGNMPLDHNLMPLESRPKCIYVSPYSWLMGSALNAVGLSGPGAQDLFKDGRWQRMTEPFFLSFMSVAEDPLGRLAETQRFADLFMKYRDNIHANVGLQVNFSCPNVGLQVSNLIQEIGKTLETLGDLCVPLVPKLTVETPIEAALKISQHPLCEALCVSNTINFNNLTSWEKSRYFGTQKSPLEKFGGGGASGSILREKVVEWVRDYRNAGGELHINAGGGILHPQDVSALKKAEADSVSIGSLFFLRPWRIQRIIKTAHTVFS